MKSNRQNGKLEQWVMERAFKEEIEESIHGNKKREVFFNVQLSLLNRLGIPICFVIDQIIIKNTNPFNKTQIVETVRNTSVRRTDMFNKLIVNLMADRLEAHARTTFGNRRNA